MDLHEQHGAQDGEGLEENDGDDNADDGSDGQARLLFRHFLSCTYTIQFNSIQFNRLFMVF